MKKEKWNICHSEHSLACHNNNLHRVHFTLPLPTCLFDSRCTQTLVTVTQLQSLCNETKSNLDFCWCSPELFGRIPLYV